MRSAPLLVMLTVVTGCNPPEGGLRVTRTFQNEVKTKCVKVTARRGVGESLSTKPNALNRASDTLTLGIAETDPLLGEVSGMSDPGAKGGGGGGGSAGVISIRAAKTCTRGGAVVSGFTFTSLNGN